MAETCLLAIRRPVYRRRDSHPGSTAELENLDGDAPREAESTDASDRGGLLRNSGEVG